MIIEGIGGIVLGVFLREWTRCLWSLFRKRKPKPTPPRKRDVGDILMHPTCKLPVVLLERFTEGQFRARYITPNAEACGALLKKEPVDENTDWLAMCVEDREMWKDYPHKLSDGESANYAKAMLTVSK